MIFSSTIALISAFAVSLAAPQTRSTVNSRSGAVSDIVVTPAITSPDNSTKWMAGSAQNVTWETDNIPPEAQNYTGVLYWGYLNAGSSDEHLDVDHPLATGFLLVQGWAPITVPTQPRCSDNCIVVLVGDSGNASPEFTVLPAAPAELSF